MSIGSCWKEGDEEEGRKPCLSNWPWGLSSPSRKWEEGGVRGKGLQGNTEKVQSFRTFRKFRVHAYLGFEEITEKGIKKRKRKTCLVPGHGCGFRGNLIPSSCDTGQRTSPGTHN